MKTESRKILYKTTEDVERYLKNVVPRMAKTASKFMSKTDNIINYILNNNLNEIDFLYLKHHYRCFLDDNDFREKMKVGFDDCYDAADFGLYLPSDAVSTFNSSYVTDLKISLYVRVRFINNSNKKNYNNASISKNGYYTNILKEMNLHNFVNEIKRLGKLPDLTKQVCHWYDEEKNEVTFFLYFCKINDLTSGPEVSYYCCENNQQYVDASKNYAFIENYLKESITKIHTNPTCYCIDGYNSVNFGMSDKLWMKMIRNRR